MSWIQNHLIETLLIVGIALLIIEIVMFGFASFIFIFISIGAISTAGLIYFDIIPVGLQSAMWSTAIITLLSALALWSPLKSIQKTEAKKTVQSDLIGYQFTLAVDVSPQSFEPARYRYSGIEWKLQSEQPLSRGTKVEVSEVEVGVFHVKPVSKVL